MLDVASRCVRCGYEIRESDEYPLKSSASISRRARREGAAYSAFAQFSLEVWALLAILGIVVALGVALMALVLDKYFENKYGVLRKLE